MGKYSGVKGLVMDLLSVHGPLTMSGLREKAQGIYPGAVSRSVHQLIVEGAIEERPSGLLVPTQKK